MSWGDGSQAPHPAVPEQGWLQQEREVGAPSEDLAPDFSLVPEYPKNLFFFDR